MGLTPVVLLCAACLSSTSPRRQWPERRVHTHRMCTLGECTLYTQDQSAPSTAMAWRLCRSPVPCAPLGGPNAASAPGSNCRGTGRRGRTAATRHTPLCTIAGPPVSHRNTTHECSDLLSYSCLVSNDSMSDSWHTSMTSALHQDRILWKTYLNFVLLKAVAAHDMAAVRQRHLHHLHTRHAVWVLRAAGIEQTMIRE